MLMMTIRIGFIPEICLDCSQSQDETRDSIGSRSSNYHHNIGYAFIQRSVRLVWRIVYTCMNSCCISFRNIDLGFRTKDRTSD